MSQTNNPLARIFKYIDHPSFSRSATDAQLFPPEQPLPVLPPIALLDATAYREVRTPTTLSKADEQRMFLAYNLARCRAAQAQREAATRKAALVGLTLWANRADHLREYLTRINLSLVPYVFHLRRDRLIYLDADDALALGMSALLRAIDGFNVANGFKFSTFAVRIIINEMSRSGQRAAKRAMAPLGKGDYQLSDGGRGDPVTAAQVKDDLAKLRRVLAENKVELTSAERKVLKHRFRDGKPMTHKDCGTMLGVTKERARQIELQALAKLRTAFEVAS